MRTLLFLLVAVLAVAFVSCRRPWPGKVDILLNPLVGNHEVSTVAKVPRILEIALTRTE